MQDESTPVAGEEQKENPAEMPMPPTPEIAMPDKTDFVVGGPQSHASLIYGLLICLVVVGTGFIVWRQLHTSPITASRSARHVTQTE
jgi:hypothetical protein